MAVLILVVLTVLSAIALVLPPRRPWALVAAVTLVLGFGLLVHFVHIKPTPEDQYDAMGRSMTLMIATFWLALALMGLTSVILRRRYPVFAAEKGSVLLFFMAVLSAFPATLGLLEIFRLVV